MKVRRLVEMLYQTYDPEQEVMAVWWGSESFETTKGVWELACKMFDGEYVPKDMQDYIAGIVCDAEAEIEEEENKRYFAELASDQYLERVREEQANV